LDSYTPKSDQPLISITIPTFNSEKTICNCLSSIFNQNFNDIEVIIIDNHSTDKTEEICNQYHCTFMKIASSKAEARKIGFYHSRGSYLLLLDSDMCLETDLLFDLANSVENNDFDAMIIEEEFPSRSIFHRAKNIEKKCYIGELDIQSPRFYRKQILQNVTWDNLDDGWDESQIFLEAKVTDSCIGFCQKRILLLEKPVDLGKKFRHCKYLRPYRERYKTEKAVTNQFNFKHRYKLLRKAFKISYPYAFLILMIKFLEIASCLTAIFLTSHLNGKQKRQRE
jgi:glycosyltransferase involved in cell wall biosynthesis